MSENNLKPCPFCGGEPKMEVLGGKGSDHRTVQCSKCKCDLHWQITEEFAIAAWNTRHDPQRQRLVDALKAAQSLADAMETCHQCKGTVLVEEQPVHCEDCSWECESHEGSECPTIYGLHLDLKRKLAVLKEVAE